MSYRLFEEEEKIPIRKESSDKLQKAKESFIKDFKYIKSLGFVKTHEHHDGGVGRTFETLIGVDENNLSIADYKGCIELKSKRSYSESLISLFSKSPSFPKKANTLLRERFGHKESRFGHKILNTTIKHSGYNNYLNEWGFKLKIYEESKRLDLKIKRLNSNRLKNQDLLRFFGTSNTDNTLERTETMDDFPVYWTFDSLKKIVETKLKLIAFIDAKTKKYNGGEEYYFNKAILLSGLDFFSFLESIRNDNIVLDIRLGVYLSGKNIGKKHDHGSAFRVRKSKIKEVFHVELID